MRQQDFRRVRHFDQPFAAHFENADLESGSESVFNTAQDAVDVVVVAFELQYHVDDVFEDFRTGDDSVFRDVPDDDDGCVGLLRVFHQQCSTLADLRNAARRRIDRIGVGRLDRVDDDHVGLVVGHLAQDVLEVRFAVNVTFVVADPDPFGPHFYLMRRLLARDVKRFDPARFQCELQAECRFTDARLAAQQDHRALHEAAAQHAVHLAVAQVGAGVLLPLDLAYRLRAVPFTGGGERGLRRLFLYRFFDKGIPFPARGALADPFGRLVPAVTAKKGLFDFSHGSRCVLRPR